MKKLLLILLFVPLVSFAQTVSEIDGTKDCLANYDWLYPSENDVKYSWKFLSDGTFNMSTSMMGGMSAWGKWDVNTPGQVELTYTRTTLENYVPDGQTLKMSSCNSLLVGSTKYSKY